MRAAADGIVHLWGKPEIMRIVARPLDGGTAAQIVSSPAGRVVQVNCTIAGEAWPAIVRHVQDAHTLACDTTYCTEARDWLHPPAPISELTAASA